MTEYGGILLIALAKVLDIALNIYMIIIIARAVISWFSPNPYNPIVQFLYRSTEPVLWRVRRLIPFGGTGIDFSPLVVILIIIFLQGFVVQSLLVAGYKLKLG